MKRESRDVLVALVNLALTAAVVILADPGLRFEARMRLDHWRRKIDQLAHETEPSPSPAEITAVHAEALKITREATA